MNVLAASLLAATLAQSPPITPGVHELTFATRGGGSMLYAISIPRNYDPQTPAPLVLVLHSGGERMRYYGSAFMRLLVAPALGLQLHDCTIFNARPHVSATELSYPYATFHIPMRHV